MYSNVAFWLYGVNVVNNIFGGLGVILGLLLLGRFTYLLYLYIDDHPTKLKIKEKRKVFRTLIWVFIAISIASFIPSQEELLMFMVADNIDTYIMQNSESALSPQSILQSVDNTSRIILGISEEIKTFFEGGFMTLVVCLICGSVRHEPEATGMVINSESKSKNFEICPCPVCGETQLFDNYEVQASETNNY